jgi:hypothetical protein
MTIVSKDWRLGPDTNTLDYSCSASIAAHGVAKIVDKGILVRLNSVRNFQWSGSYRVADESLPDDLLYDNFEDTVGREGPWKSMRVEIRPAFGDTFVYGSIVISRASGDWDVCDARSLPGRVLRYRPYQDVRVSSLLRGRRSKAFNRCKGAAFPVAASGGEAGADDDSQHSEEVLLTWSRDPKRGFYVEYSLLYPPIGTFIES